MALTAPQEAAVVMTAKRAEATMPKRTSFAFHVAAGEAERRERIVAVRLGPVADDDAGDEQRAHGGEDGPALALIADHSGRTRW